ncbi:11095_t:CDS:1 [Acaulospora colombiana]|uniref:11095_t:CDS:1 n=1 Tax=Acaulospora colombiana TaxID=27376 RepID=A0ACA9M7H2_9GLOM|nr:11095_t:CDS:1 [Acaulospora colombiana]
MSDIDRLEELSNGSKPIAQRRKSRPGWKGWVEVEGSPEPKDKLINLDFPVETLETRTRSGKILPPHELSRVRKASTAKSSSTGASNTPAPGDISPLGPGVRHTNTTIEDNPGEV